MMRKNLGTAATTLALCVAIAVPAAAQQTFDQRIQAVMDRPEFRHAMWGAEFYDLMKKHEVRPEDYR